MKNTLWKRLGLFLLAGFAAATAAVAAPNIAIENRIEQRQVVVVNGREEVRFVPAKTTLPGGILHITIAYRNSGDQTAKDVALTNPVPEGTYYLNGSATTREGLQTEFSIDGGKSYKKPTLLTYEVKLPNGTVETQIASPEQYTHIRWQLAAVPAGASGEVSFEALVQ
jgi:uncharacterized repeat protein (TIGR01451 family)